MRIERALLAHHAADHVAEERGLGRQILLALDLAADPMAFEFGQDVVEPRAGDIHLIERLHGGEPRRAAPVGLARPSSLRSATSSAPALAASALEPTSASAARAASPPLSCSAGRARAQACASVSTVRMPLPIGSRRATDEIHQARARIRMRHDVVVDGLAADHAAERDRAVVGLPRASRAASSAMAIAGRNFQRARHA